MKKIVASVGLVALGASGLSAHAAALGDSPTKPWSISATLRGFYDDNTATLPDNSAVPAGSHRDSFGFEISPSAGFVWTREQTSLTLGYLFSLKYYDHVPINSTSHDDESHTFNFALNHAFNERFSGKITDSFVIGQEPDLIRAGNTFSTFQRISGNNIRNYGTVSFDGQITPKFGVNVTYDNAYYDYQASGADVGGTTVVASPAGALNRDENGIRLEGLMVIQPETKGLIGYQFRDVSYMGDELIGGTVFHIAGTPYVVGPVMSEVRNSRQHVVYLGGIHNFRPDFTGSLKVGGSYTDYYNDAGTSGSFSPYVDASLRWTYAVESYIEGGFTYNRNATDQVNYTGANNFTLDQESAVVFATVNHRITPHLFANATGQFQNSSFNGGTIDGETEQYYLLGLNLEYRFNMHFSTHVGYNYDKLASGIGRSFDRNRIYIGVTASY